MSKSIITFKVKIGGEGIELESISMAKIQYFTTKIAFTGILLHFTFNKLEELFF